jgi:hypothetical protein
MEENHTLSVLERKLLSHVAQVQLYVPSFDNEANPIIIKRNLKIGERDNNARGWRSVSDVSSHCFYPAPHLDNSARAFTLGNQMISRGLGWENYDIKYPPVPSGYAEWGTTVLAKHFKSEGGG